MKTDDESIREACSELGTLVRTFETRALRARAANEDGPKLAAMEDVQESVLAITAALERVSRLALRRDRPVRAGIPDPVTDLDQEPQD